jgi:methylenetetrahydrofolate dehydrogenase (NADP+)/methenyltetrahydrofolate cyclohydrolase
MTEILSGKEVVADISAHNIEVCQKLKKQGINPCLAIIRVGQNVDDLYYENTIIANCEKTGIHCRCINLPENVGQTELSNEIRQVSGDPDVHAIFFFCPLPKGLDEQAARAQIAPEKDIDSLTKTNAGKIYLGEADGFAPCTPAAIMEILHHYKLPVAGKHAVVVGRSLVVGKPLAMLLLQENATVTICHSKTENLDQICKNADILIAAVGRAKMLGEAAVNPNQIVIDVGINADPENPNKICGDVDFEKVSQKVQAITPVPGGVGTVTTAVLLKHCLQAAKRSSQK